MNNPQKKGVQGTLVFPSFPKRWGGYAIASYFRVVLVDIYQGVP